MRARYRVLLGGRQVKLESVKLKASQVEEATVIRRLRDAISVIRHQAEAGELHGTHLFESPELAREFAIMALQEIQGQLSDEFDEIQAFQP